MSKTVAIGNSKLHLLVGDITEMNVDAIVNAANEFLILGAGVAGAINDKGGPEIQRECTEIGGSYVGGAVITSAGKLNAKYVIHAVGPRMGEGDEHNKLSKATHNSLLLAKQNNLKSIAFPAISTGIFGFPIKDCARIMINEAIQCLVRGNGVSEVYFVLWNDENYNVFVDELNIQVK